MMDQKSLDALTSTIYAARMGIAGIEIDTDDKRIRVSGLYDEWKPGVHEIGEISNANGQTWEVHQRIDDNANPGVIPGNSAWPTFYRPLHAATPETARPWVKPQFGTTDIYKVGEYMIWTDGKVYRSLRDTNFSPEEYADDWEVCNG